jgi:alanine-glyoxylate transaminase/serine-glyoxylate transaminase/serine-pyruvate transaminase
MPVVQPLGPDAGEEALNPAAVNPEVLHPAFDPDVGIQDHVTRMDYGKALDLGPRAVEKLANRQSKVTSWYLDLTMIQQYWTERRRTYHHTAPVSMNYALHEALALVLEEGLERRYERHRRHSRALMAGLKELGFRPSAQEGHRLPVLNAVWVPSEIDEAQVRRQLLDRYNIEIGGGLGELSGKIWRIGLMGESARRDHVHTLLEALGELLASGPESATAKASLDAARQVYVS